MSTLFKNAAISGSIEGFIVGVMNSFGQAVEKHGEGFIKSKMFGFGTNDNHLFQSAAAYAVSNLGVSAQNIYRICRIINSYKPSQRDRIVRIIGNNEENTNVSAKTTSSKSDKKDGGTEKKGDSGKSSIPTRGSAKTNVEGAYILAMLAKMENYQIKEFFAASGAIDTIAVKTEAVGKKVFTKVKTAAEKGAVVKDAESFFKRKTWLEKLADGEI
ncbi:MAG: hypothetical protein WC545_00455 [Patescibacteria group bacterium]|jgi:hypothetical protein